ncbi:MAG: SEC-C metal-binding domain-containing protein [Chlamydiota bacterium]
MYCPDVDCDCRKVDILVVGEDGKKHCTLTFGWEKEKYYTHHFGFPCPQLPGPGLAPLQFQGPYAQVFLEHFLLFCVSDKGYVDRLKRHCQLIKDKFKTENFEQYLKQGLFRREEKLGRNDPCSCGSQKKYKNCCQR